MVHNLIFCSTTILLFVWLIMSNFSWLTLILFVLWLIRLIFLKNPVVLWSSLILVVLMTARLYVLQTTNHSVMTGDETNFKVRVDRLSVKIDGDNMQFYGIVDDFDENIVVFYTIEGEEELNKILNHEFPEYLSISGALSLPNAQRNFHTFDYQNFLKSKQIYWTLEAKSYETIASELEHPLHPRQWRYGLLTWINKVIPQKVAEYINMLLFSDLRELDGDMQKYFVDLGIIHMISISGMNIALFIDMIRYGLLRAGVVREKIPFILLIFLPIYGVLTGLGTSVFRAIVQHGLKASGEIFNWSFDTLDYWSLTLLIALFISPGEILSAGFQFSYLLSFSLYMIKNISIFNKCPELLKDIPNSAILSLISLPILTYHYFEFPWYTLLANSIFAPFFSFVLLPGSVLSLGVALVPLEGIRNFFYMIFEWSIIIFEFIVKEMGQLPSLTFITGRLSSIALIFLIFGLISLVWSLTSNKKSIIHICLSFGIIITAVVSNKLLPETKVVMLDVGQGDSILYIEPFMRSVTLIDTGGQMVIEEEKWRQSENPYRIGDRLVVPALKALGVSTIDYLILSHADTDHIGELDVIAKQLKITNIIMTRQTEENISIEEGKYIILEGSEQLKLKNGMEIIAPNDYYINAESKNNASLITYVKIQDDGWLFTGDIEESAEKKMAETYNDLEVDILKVAHHGSNTSTTQEFLETFTPSISLISAGENNWYGHPHPDVIERLTAYNSKIYRTDLHGAIMFTYSSVTNSRLIKTVRREEM